MTVIVFFHIATTGFDRDDEIIQIAARCRWHSSFNVYITPTKSVDPRANEVNKLQLFNGRLYLHNKQVRSTSDKNAFKKFMHYLQRFNEDVILVAHNCARFHMSRMLNLAENLGFLDIFKKLVKGYNDSQLVLEKILKKRRKEKKSFSLSELVQHYLPTALAKYNIHNAVHNTKILSRLLEKLAINDEHFVHSSKSIDQYLHKKIELSTTEAELGKPDKIVDGPINKFFKTVVKDRLSLSKTEAELEKPDKIVDGPINKCFKTVVEDRLSMIDCE